MKTVVEQIKERLPITEVIASYITVEQSGNQYKAKCPFHNERTASFYISPDRGLYYCFGCGAKGDVFSFVSSFEGLDFKGTLKILADRAGISLATYKGEVQDNDPLYAVLDTTASRYETMLTQTPDALAYLKQRGVQDATIAVFRIGYAPDEWRFVTNSCQGQKEQQYALAAGLLKQSEGKTYDRFRGRIMFPITDTSGRVVAFSGRAFPGDGDGAKYLNSPETALFKKSNVLFGFDKAKLHIKKHNFAILVEGQMDLVLSHQAGFKNTVATSGTAVSEDAAKDPFSNLSVLARLTPHLFLAFDGDSAGQKAMDRAALVALTLGMNPKVVVLPEGNDPADYILKEGADAWKERLKESKHFIVHHLDRIRALKLSPHVFAKTIKETIFPFLVRVASPIERAAYITMISQAIGVSVSDITAELATVQVPTITNEQPQGSFSSQGNITPYERLVALRKQYPSKAIETLCEPLNSLGAGDMVFTAPSIIDDRMTQALLIVEREYGGLSDEDKEGVAKELIKKIINNFLVTARQHFSGVLHASEGNTEVETQTLAVLSDINARLHTE